MERLISIRYLFQSGFLVETDRRLLLFDYYPDKVAQETGAGRLSPEELPSKPLLVLVSHRHGDHYQPAIWVFLKKSDTRYLLSDDIQLSLPLRGNPRITRIGPDQSIELEEGFRVSTLRSTDEGVAFLLHCDDLCLFHAGDLNWWHWNGEPEEDNRLMGEQYRREIQKLRGQTIDAAFIPTDPRLEEHALLGLAYFMETAGASHVFPMHFGEDSSIFSRLSQLPYHKQIVSIPYRDFQITLNI